MVTSLVNNNSPVKTVGVYVQRRKIIINEPTYNGSSINIYL